MGEVLSQSEIDNLLAALSTGELDVDEMADKGDKQIKNYDEVSCESVGITRLVSSQRM